MDNFLLQIMNDIFVNLDLPFREAAATLNFFSNSSLEIKSDLEEEEEEDDEEDDEEDATNLRWQCYKRLYNCNLRESVVTCNL
jgi:hypothetical protein